RERPPARLVDDEALGDFGDRNDGVMDRISVFRPREDLDLGGVGLRDPQLARRFDIPEVVRVAGEHHLRCYLLLHVVDDAHFVVCVCCTGSTTPASWDVRSPATTRPLPSATEPSPRVSSPLQLPSAENPEMDVPSSVSGLTRWTFPVQPPGTRTRCSWTEYFR